MRLDLRLIFAILAALPNILWAVSTPVVIEPPLSENSNALKSMNFRLHARSGDALIGTVDISKAADLPPGVCTLPLQVLDFKGVYQTDKRAMAIAGRFDLQILFESENWVLFKGDEQSLSALSTAGVPFRAISARPLPFDQIHHRPPQVDTINPFVGVVLDRISASSYQNFIQTLQNFSTRNSYNTQCNNAASWILQTLQSYGLSASVDTFQVGDSIRYNIIAQKTGTQTPNQIYYIIAHYDATAGLPIAPEASAPGADDNGSGAALALECARVIAQFDFYKTIRIAFFAGNEQGLIGSEAYAAGLPLPGETYLGVFNADMTGYSGMDPWPPDLVLYSNNTPASQVLANKVMEAAGLFAPNMLQMVLLNDPTMVYSDHAPFWDLNIGAVLAMEDEAWGDDLNPYYHSTSDLIQYLDIPYAVQILKVLLASAADLAIPMGSMQAYLTAAPPIINDALGNNNGQIEYGEFIYLTLPVVNAGGASATGVNVTLSESDPYITFSDWQQNYGTITSFDTVQIADAFAADVSDTVRDEHIFDITVTMTSGTNTWQSLVQMAAHAPDIIISSFWVNDTSLGNGNGQLELGETADLNVKLLNQGSYQALNLTNTLATTSPFVSIQTPTANYGTLPTGGSAIRPYRLSIAQVAPAFFQAPFSLTYSVQGGWTDRGSLTLNVGDITYMPTGPDPYGYSAYDINDEPFGPIYEWIEIDPTQGGPGTEVDFTAGDQTLYVNLPFTFRFYGMAYTELSICSNGWIACGRTTSTDYSNSAIPNSDGPPAMIAGYWDDFSPQLEGSVSTYYDSLGGKFIVEYYHVRHYYPSTSHETFEVVLFDTAMYPTNTGDGRILIQYAEVDLVNSCTVGIEDAPQQVGIQYLYNNSYAATASQLRAGMAVLYTPGQALPDVQVTLSPIGTPIIIPPGGGSFNFTIAVVNNEPIAYTFDVWCDVTLPNGNLYGPVLGPVTLTFNPSQQLSRLRTQAVPAGAPPGNYSYNAYVGEHPIVTWSSASFPFTKVNSGSNASSVAQWANWGEPMVLGWETAATDNAELPKEFSLGQNFPNPFNPRTVLSYELRAASCVSLRVYDTAGRLVATLVNGWRDAGSHQVTFDGSHLTSGIYFYRLQAGEYVGVKKLILLK